MITSSHFTSSARAQRTSFAKCRKAQNRPMMGRAKSTADVGREPDLMDSITCTAIRSSKIAQRRYRLVAILRAAREENGDKAA